MTKGNHHRRGPWLALLVLAAAGCGHSAPIASVSATSTPPATTTPTGTSAIRSAAAGCPVGKANEAAHRPARHTVAKPVVGANAHAEKTAAEENRIPPVLLTAGHRKLCRVVVGDRLPAITLPQLGGDITKLAKLQGHRATVVLFWHPDRWMARAALIDFMVLAKQVDAKKVALVGIAVGQPAGAVQSQLNQTRVIFPQLLDTAGTAFAQVGTAALPRVYVLDAEGKIVWFDIEYSEATRRELRQTLSVLTE